MKTYWAVKTREDGPNIFYQLTETLEEAISSMHAYRASERQWTATTRHHFYVVRDKRGIA